jgi:hypothetical protein
MSVSETKAVPAIQQTPRQPLSERMRISLMEIKQLVLVVTEQDLNQIARRHLPKDFAVSDFHISVDPDGLKLSGRYSMLVRVPFETLWEMEVVNGKVNARLVKAKALGLPVTKFISMFMNLLWDALSKEAWIEQTDDLLIIDVEKLLEEEGFTVRMNLQRLRCQTANLLLEANDSATSAKPA